MVAVSSSGIHFKEPWQFLPSAAAVAVLRVKDSGDVTRASDTTAFFTEMARRGLQDQTNWTGGTYKTLLSVSSGKGHVAALVGCTAGGSETTTFEITVDGALVEIAIPVAVSQRATLLAKHCGEDDYTTAGAFLSAGAETLDATKSYFSALHTNTGFIPDWHSMVEFPMLIFKKSLLIRAKHSVNITNATATAYSAVMYRLGL